MRPKPKITHIDPKVLELARKKLYFKERPIEFIESFIYLPISGEDELMKLYDPQKVIVKSFFQNHNLILLKSRQIGMSTLTQALITYIFTFYENCVVGIVSRDGSESSDFCRKVINMLDKLPDWLRPEYDNKAMQYFILKNGCQLHTGTVSPANPGSVFRSKSITMLVIDEAAHIRNIDEAWTGMASTVSKAQMDAEKNNVPFGTIILSTPNKTEGIGKWFFQMWTSARRQENSFLPHRIHWKEIPVFANNPNWYDQQCKILNNNKNKIWQELELKFVGSEDALFDAEIQVRLQSGAIQPLEKLPIPIIRGKGDLNKYKEINRSHFHIIGVDSATAAGDDNSAIQVIEYETMEQVLEFNGKVDPKELTKVVQYIHAICPHNIIVVENQGGYGQSVIYDLIEDEEIHYNLYGVYAGKEKQIFVPGLSTNPKTRPLILDSLYDYITHDPDLVHSEKLAMELLGLVRRTNKIEADKGFHDDLALAYGFCCYIRKYCGDAIGDVSTLQDDTVNEYVKDSMSIMETLSGDAPFRGYRIQAMEEKKEDPEFRNNLDKYIKEKYIAGELTGMINVRELLGSEFF
jgi:hypothetical protein